MRTKEKKLLLVLLALGLIFFLVKGIPWMLTVYQEGREEVADLKKKRRYLNALIKAQPDWEKAYQLRQNIEKILHKETYHGDSRELIAAKLQGDLSNLAKSHQLSVESMNLPEYVHNQDMLLIMQTMTFKGAEDHVVNMLTHLYHQQPRLVIINMDIRQFGTQLSSTIKVVGFYKLDEDSYARLVKGDKS